MAYKTKLTEPLNSDLRLKVEIDGSGSQYRYHTFRDRSRKRQKRRRTTVDHIQQDVVTRSMISNTLISLLKIMLLGLSILLRLITYIAGAVTAFTVSSDGIFVLYTFYNGLPILVIMFGIPVIIFVSFLIFCVLTACNSYTPNKFIAIHMQSICFKAILLPFYFIFAVLTGLQQAPYLQYRINHGYSFLLYSFINQFNVSKEEREYRYIVVQFYLMANYMVSYESYSDKQSYLRNNNHCQLMDYKTICVDNFYELQFESLGRSNIFHVSAFDICQCEKHWRKIHYKINTLYGVMFYMWKITVWIVENVIVYSLFNYNEYWWIWIGLNTLRNLWDIYKFYYFVMFNIWINSYYFDNDIVASILSWKKMDVVCKELNSYYWDFVTRLTCQDILYEYLNEINIATIIQSYIGLHTLKLTSVQRDSFQHYCHRTRPCLIYCEGI